MNLPLVLDIAIGLIFIFLILSLLASEIQELITTLLQWRADHLKKSIEVLLAGSDKEAGAFQEFANALYLSPLIQALNQESKGIFPQSFRKITRNIGAAYRRLTGARNVFGSETKGPFTGPSYIPARTFSDALLQKLNLDFLTQKLSEFTIQKFGDDRLVMVEDVLKSLRNSMGDDSLLEAEFNGLKQRLQEIGQDFRSGRISLSRGLDLAIDQIKQFIDSTEEYLKNNNHCKAIIVSRLPYLRQAVQLKKLEPTISEVLAMILGSRDAVPHDFEAVFQQLQAQGKLSPQVQEIAEAVEEIRAQAANLPPQLKENLLVLANQAQMKAEGLKDGVRKLEKEVEDWFNRSMDRASGVYKRNSKGVAIMLGILIATLTNTDTFLIVDRLSRDTAVRSAIAQSANQLAMQGIQPTRVTDVLPPLAAPNPNALPGEVPASSPEAASPAEQQITAELTAVRDSLDRVLDEIPLPIGWNQLNTAQQFPPRSNLLMTLPKALLGWLITGIAISMGSSFWFDVLGKVMRVRNTGNPTKPTPSD